MVNKTHELWTLSSSIIWFRGGGLSYMWKGRGCSSENLNQTPKGNQSGHGLSFICLIKKYHLKPNWLDYRPLFEKGVRESSKIGLERAVEIKPVKWNERVFLFLFIRAHPALPDFFIRESPPGCSVARGLAQPGGRMLTTADCSNFLKAIFALVPWLRKLKRYKA